MPTQTYTPPAGDNVILNFESTGFGYTPPSANGQVILEFGFVDGPSTFPGFRYFIAIDGMS